MQTHPLAFGVIRWILMISVLFAGITLGLLNAREFALQYWYLLAAPLMVSSFRFGLRGATAAGGMSVLILIATFYNAGRSFSDASDLLTRAAVATMSVSEVTDLVRELADLREADPQTAFARSLLGLALVMGAGVMLGAAIDAQRRALTILERAFNAMRRYFSPQVIDRILTSADTGADATNLPSVRKEITVLFADLRGFTAMVERMEPEEVATLLNEFFGAMTDEIFKQDGTLDKFIGDCVMAFFGDPVWYADHPERAFRAAIAMQGRMRDLQSKWQAEGRDFIGMGIGISTGHAVVGNTGSASRMDYTAIGSTVNIAARLTDLARGGEILTTRKTYWRVQHIVEGMPREPVSVKGFAQAVEIVEVVGARLVPLEGEASLDTRAADMIRRVVEDSAFRALVLGSPDEATSMFGLTEEQRELAQHIAVLRGYPIFQDVPADEIALLVESVSVESYRQGTVVVRQGTPEDGFYVIARGDVTVTAVDELERERHIASLARGDCFGEVALLFDTPRTATVRAASDSSFLVLHADKFYDVLDRAPALRDKLEALGRSRMDQPFMPRRGESPFSEPDGVVAAKAG